VGRPVRAWQFALVALILLPLPGFPEEGVPNANQFDWIREYLAEFSLVTDGGSAGPRDLLWTRLERHPDAGRAVLTYQRATYSGAAQTPPDARQLIHYTVRLSDLDARAVTVERWEGFHSRHEFWLVRAVIREGAELIPYTNVFERRIDADRVDVTSSRGQVREIVLGYFETETDAARLADNFQDMLEQLAA
jgi:hypothetical protein